MELKQSLMDVIAQELREIEDEMDDDEDRPNTDDDDDPNTKSNNNNNDDDVGHCDEAYHECPICHGLFLTHGFMLEHMWLRHRHDDNLATPDNLESCSSSSISSIVETENNALQIVEEKMDEDVERVDVALMTKEEPKEETAISCSVSGRQSWTCARCDAVFIDDLKAFKNHLMRTHKLHKDIFQLSDPLKNPTLITDNVLPKNLKRCESCDECFRSSSSLELHRLRRHVSKSSLQTGARIACPICSKHFDDLTAHARSEHKLDGVICPLCGKILSKTCTLNRHIEQVHLNLQIHKPAQCLQCGKMFSKKGHLDRHIRTIHQGQKEGSEPCPICGKVFSTKSSLEPHIEMVHKGVRKKCPECGKVLSDLWKHMRTVHGFYRRRSKIPKDQVEGEEEFGPLDLANNENNEKESIVSKRSSPIKATNRSPRLRKGVAKTESVVD